MQTYLPYVDYVKSLESLDSKRLGNQRREALQVLRTLCGLSTGWKHHPVVRMWSGNEGSLCVYGLTACAVWRSRGYRDNLTKSFLEMLLWCPSGSFASPDWLGSEEFHSSHRSALLSKHPQWYDQFGWDDPPRVCYFWPRA
jgi:hypothetical protein